MPDPITPAERADLRRLEAAATPGKWETRHGYIKEPGLCRVRLKAREPDRIGRPIFLPVAECTIFLPVAECIHAPDAALIVAACNNLIRLLDALDAAEARIAEIACSWADDHTHLQSLCRAAGIPEQQVSGDSYGVPGIGDLADLLAGKVAALRAEVERLRTGLRCIEAWELPPATNAAGQQSDYETEFGSNGARDFIRGIAAALLKEPDHA